MTATVHPLKPHERAGQWTVMSSLYIGMGAAVVDNTGPRLRTIAEVRKYQDANKIAAAPDLLEALDWLLASVNEAYPDGKRRSSNPDDHERLQLAKAGARSAIFKALGKCPPA